MGRSAALLVDEEDVIGDEVRLLTVPECDEPFETAVTEFVVSVEDGDPLTGGTPETFIARRGRTVVLRKAHERDPFRELRACGDDFRRFVRGGIVHDNNVDADAALMQSRIDGRLDRRSSVEGRDDDRDPLRDEIRG